MQNRYRTIGNISFDHRADKYGATVASRINADAGAKSIRQQKTKVLLPVFKGNATPDVIGIASLVLSSNIDELTLLGIVCIPDGESLSGGAMQAHRMREALDKLDIFADVHGILTKGVVKVRRDVCEALNEIIHDGPHGTVILPWREIDKDDPDCRALAESLLTQTSIDLIIVKPGTRKDCRRVLARVVGDPRGNNNNQSVDNAEQLERMGDVSGCSPSDILCSNTAFSIAERFDAGLDLIASGQEETNEGEAHSLEVISYSGSMIEEINSTIADESTLVMVKAAAKPLLDVTLGTKESSVNQVDTAVSRVVAGSAISPGLNRGIIRSATVSETVERWFAESTFNSEEFFDIEKLIELKRRQGLTISLGLPTLNEEQTIGNVIEIVKMHLQDNYPLLDEIAVIDSNSTDRTVDIAVGHGVSVIDETKVLADKGIGDGKGCALWKSLYALNGDIIVWVDTDIKNIHPRFVYGLVGPLLKYSHLQYVKGYYRRPLDFGDKFVETGGGRVTELTARPLLNYYYPELSGLIQPLSGEYAGRREILESVGFYNGYGVEIGLLINILEKYGLDAIAQVDLDERIHRNQSLKNLSKMSFAIIQVIMDSIARRGADAGEDELTHMNRTLRQVHQDTKHLCLESNDIIETMYPPMNTIPEYREKFNPGE